MRVLEKILSPGMEHTKKADVSTKMFGIGRNLQQGRGTGVKQQTVQNLLVVKHQGSQLMRQREDHMHIARREKFLATRRKPAVASTRLTLRAVPVAARVVGDGAMSTAGAFIKVAAERGSATPRNGQQHFDVLPSDPRTASFDESVSRGAD